MLYYMNLSMKRRSSLRQRRVRAARIAHFKDGLRKVITRLDSYLEVSGCGDCPARPLAQYLYELYDGYNPGDGIWCSVARGS